MPKYSCLNVSFFIEFEVLFVSLLERTLRVFCSLCLFRPFEADARCERYSQIRSVDTRYSEIQYIVDNLARYFCAICRTLPKNLDEDAFVNCLAETTIGFQHNVVGIDGDIARHTPQFERINVEIDGRTGLAHFRGEILCVHFLLSIHVDAGELA